MGPPSSLTRGMDEYLVKYDVHLSSRIKVEFYPMVLTSFWTHPMAVYTFIPRFGAGVEAVDDKVHPQCSHFLQSPPSQLSGVA